MMEGYNTLSGIGRDEVVLQKSRFIGSSCPCKSEEEALDFLIGIRAEFPDARHHCYAYSIGANRGIMRYSDDAEPQGTAGLPILETMKNMDVTNACVVVTRYFGGILLGTGGLTRAYRTGCQIAIQAAGIQHRVPGVCWNAEMPYPDWEKVRRSAKDWPVQMENIQYGERVSVLFSMRLEDETSVLNSLATATNGIAVLTGRMEREIAWMQD